MFVCIVSILTATEIRVDLLNIWCVVSLVALMASSKVPLILSLNEPKNLDSDDRRYQSIASPKNQNTRLETIESC